MGRGRCQTEFAIFSPDSRNARQNIREGAKIVQQGPEPRVVNESSFVCFEEMQLGGLSVSRQDLQGWVCSRRQQQQAGVSWGGHCSLPLLKDRPDFLC